MNARMNIALGISIFIALPLNGFAWDGKKCSNLLRDGLYKKYEFQSAGESAQKYGFFSGSTRYTTEPTTAMLDPKFWVHSTTSYVQSTSSFGDCKLIGLMEMGNRRELCFAQNRDELLREISRGSGEHLEVLAAFSLCEDRAYSKFTQKLQGKMRSFLELPKDQHYGKIIDSALKEDAELSQQCLPYS